MNAFHDNGMTLAAPMALGLIALIALIGGRLLYAGIFFAAALAAAVVGLALRFAAFSQRAERVVEREEVAL